MLTFFIIVTSIVSACLTFYVNEHLKQGPVRSSALLSLIVGTVFYVLRGKIADEIVNNIPIVFIGASFIGMVSTRALSEIRLIAFAGFVFSLIYINTSHFFKGYGGALGTSASIAVMATMCIPIFIPRKRTINGILIIRKWILKDKKRKRNKWKKGEKI
ncbi:MAG: hypothetical protein DI598_11405 [Pseudopedobacter saltans]|uniref:Uncharacterized protein n=1 Tax=Pseudopedobacter saltans TaxID=151895 RepID=A0A2W5EYN2_9SPHI|nr:MAG: hypothetical protein DI598_11405 [Pseudopedobacter saltans]